MNRSFPSWYGKVTRKLFLSTMGLLLLCVGLLSTELDLALPSFFGNQPVYAQSGATIGDWVWYDRNGDSLQAPTETGIANVTVELRDGTCTPNVNCPTAVTDAQGLYHFDALPDGEYIVHLDVTTLPPGMALTTLNDILVTLQGRDFLDADFGVDDSASIGDMVWRDYDGDGFPSGGDETGINGVTVNLYDASAKLVDTTITFWDGSYKFMGLPAGEYHVLVDETTLPAGYQATTPNPVIVHLTPGQSYVFANFGFAPAGALGDRVWWDIDKDGIQDEGEPGIPNVTLTLQDGITRTVTTNDDGVYTFARLEPDTYTVTVDAVNFISGSLQHWAASPSNRSETDDAHDSDGDPTTHAASITLAPGEANTTLDFGFIISSGYTLSHHINTPEPIRPGEPVSFTIYITNTGQTWIDSLALQNVYNHTYLTYGYNGHFSEPPSDDNIDDGVLDWADALSGAPLAPDAGRVITITFTATQDSSNLPDGQTVMMVTAYHAKADPDGPSEPIPPAEELPPLQIETVLKLMGPTGVVVSDFRVSRMGNQALLQWRTENEARVLGFNLLRSEGLYGSFHPINKALIPAQHPGQSQGARYRFVDDTALSDQIYRYQLQILTPEGTTQLASEALLPPASRLFMPWFAR